MIYNYDCQSFQQLVHTTLTYNGQGATAFDLCDYIVDTIMYKDFVFTHWTLLSKTPAVYVQDVAYIIKLMPDVPVWFYNNCE